MTNQEILITKIRNFRKAKSVKDCENHSEKQGTFRGENSKESLRSLSNI